MQIKLLLVISVFITGLFVSCANIEPVLIDNSIPIEKTAEVYFSSISLKYYNGFPVNRGIVFRIPEGKVEITCDITYEPYKKQGKQFTCSFEAGKRYLVSFHSMYYKGVYIFENPKKKLEGNLDKDKNTFIYFKDEQKASEERKV